MGKTLRICIAFLCLAAMLGAQNPAPRIKTGDALVITINAVEEPLKRTVQPDGTVALPLIGSVPGEGVSLSQFSDRVERALSVYLRNPKVTVRLEEEP
jgi:protein involved in polysaccharide export with SLBB domain